MKKIFLFALCVIFPPFAILWMIYGALEPIFGDHKHIPCHPEVEAMELRIELARCRVKYQETLLQEDIVLQNRRFVRLLEPDRLKLEKARLLPPPPRVIREQIREIEVRQIVAPPQWMQLPAAPPQPRRQSRQKNHELQRKPKPPKWVMEFEEQLKEDEVSLDHLAHIRSQNPDMHPSLRAKLDLAEQKIREALDIKIADARMQILKRKID